MVLILHDKSVSHIILGQSEPLGKSRERVIEKSNVMYRRPCFRVLDQRSNSNIIAAIRQPSAQKPVIFTRNPYASLYPPIFNKSKKIKGGFSVALY